MLGWIWVEACKYGKNCQAWECATCGSIVHQSRDVLGPCAELRKLQDKP